MDTPKWLTDEEQALWRLILAATRKVNRAIEESLNSGYNLTTPEFAVLVSLSEHHEHKMRLRELCTELNWDRSRTSHQITRMERRGLVMKERFAGDARGVLVVLTEEGETRLKQAVPEHVNLVRHLIFDKMTQQQSEVLQGFMRSVIDADLQGFHSSQTRSN